MEENETINDHSSFVTEENISFISNVSPVVVSNDDTLTVSSQKISGKPKSIVWGRYIKQGREVSKGHWNATCNFCGVFWYKGSPATLENHLGNLCVKVPVEVRDFFLESTKLTPQRINNINRALDILSGCLLAQETAFVNQAVIKELKNSKNLTLGML
ncbi:14089_t:CDS:2 [Entrophospora sp. SA101]|nr:14089_t:CDS:2 [Entrophospora sp. SA101]